MSWSGDSKKVNNFLIKSAKKFKLPAFFIVLGAVARVIPHLPNATPIGAIALFGGAYLPKGQALIVPLLGMAVADFFLGSHSTIAWVYGSFLLISLVGIYLKDRASVKNVFLASTFSSLLFFLVTNFGVWFSTSMYTKDLAGLGQSYLMGLPFLRNTLVGDLFYSGALFGAYYLLVVRKSTSLPYFLGVLRNLTAKAKTITKNTNP